MVDRRPARALAHPALSAARRDPRAAARRSRSRAQPDRDRGPSWRPPFGLPRSSAPSRPT